VDGNATAMSSDPSSAGALIRRWFDEVWNQGRTETIDELLSDHATMWGVGRPEQSSRGAAEFKDFHQAMRAACPDTKIVLDHVVEQGDTAFARWTVTATHTGQGGKIAEAWNLWDQIGMARQLGILEGKAAQLFS
jgi:ketosteroid isomerase-like protein